MNEDPGVVWRKLWGAKAENSLIEMIMAERLPRPVNRPPQTRGEYRGRKVDVSGSVMRATMLFPTSLALTLPCSAGTRSTTIGCQKHWDNICRVILLLVERGGGPLLS